VNWIRFTKNSIVKDMMLKKGILICFIGIDGSGKSTHAISIANSLIRDGVRCKYVWTRWFPIILKPLVVLIKTLLFNRNISKKDYVKYKSAKRGYLRKNLAKIWQNMVLSDYFLQVLIKIKLPLALGNVVVCDRYLYDTLVDLAVDSNYSKDELKDMLKPHVMLLFPKPDTVFLLDVPEKVAFKRKSDVPALTYLIDRRKLYLALAEEYPSIEVLNNSGDFDKTNCKIQDEVCRMLKSKLVKRQEK